MAATKIWHDGQWYYLNPTGGESGQVGGAVYVPEADIQPDPSDPMDDDFDGDVLDPKWTVTNEVNGALTQSISVANGMIIATPGQDLIGGQYNKGVIVTQPIPVGDRAGDWCFSAQMSQKKDTITNRGVALGVCMKFPDGRYHRFGMTLDVNNFDSLLQSYYINADFSFGGNYAANGLASMNVDQMYFRLVRSNFHGRIFLLFSPNGLRWQTYTFFGLNDYGGNPTDVGYFFGSSAGDGNETRQFHQILNRSKWFRRNNGLIF